MWEVLQDYLMFLKLLIFFYFVRWLMDSVGNNKLLFVIGLLIGGYYIFFARWSLFGTILVVLILFVMGGLGSFMQDIIFQYDSIRAAEAEHQINPMEMLRRY